MCARACGRARAAAAHLLHLRGLVVHAAWWCAVGERPPLPCTTGRACRSRRRCTRSSHDRGRVTAGGSRSM
eukprot:6668762-Prymnesium_polylepis.1